MKFRNTGILLLIMVLLSLGVIGAGYAQWTGTLDVNGTVETGIFGHNWVGCSSNDPPGTIDPGKTQDVAWCDTSISGDELTIYAIINNAYPNYQCQVSGLVHNNGTVPEMIDDVDITTSSPLLVVTDVSPSPLLGTVLYPDDVIEGKFDVHLLQEVIYNGELFKTEPDHSYYFTVRIWVRIWYMPKSGTIGYWKGWVKSFYRGQPKDYTASEVLTWLSDIDTTSSWLGPTDIASMETMLNNASGHSMENKFLGHYLAQRLDLASGRQSPNGVHDVTSIEGYQYLGLTDPSQATAQEIIDAIESKYGTSPTRDQFETMKDICVALNQLDI